MSTGLMGTAALTVPVAVGLATALSVALVWGFTVDDAWIAPRVAWNLAHGNGYRFNPRGEIVDAVTPLGWAFVLTPFAKSGPGEALAFARWFGAALWVAAAAFVGALAVREGNTKRRFLPLALLPCSLPLSAWAGAGMETGVVAALATVALHPSRWGASAAGAAAAWRPELVPWAATLLVVRAASLRELGAADGARGISASWRSVAKACVFALVPALAVATIRFAAFGRPAPLAVFAKPADASDGWSYAIAAALWTGAPLLVMAPGAWRRLPRRALAPLLASLVHFGTMVVVGGDWMAFFRLAVPCLPGLVLAGVVIAERTTLMATIARSTAALALSGLLYVDRAADARRIVEQRAHLIAALRPLVRDARSIATVDVGWVGVAFQGEIVDLAGVTDERTALLPGSHTSKRLPAGFVDRRDVDALVLLLAPGAPVEVPWTRTRFARAVEFRVAVATEGSEFRPVRTLPLLGTQQRYLIVRR